MEQPAAGAAAGGNAATQFGARRFVVLDKLLSGDPGELYLAHDPRLDRRLTLKLLHADRNYDARAAAVLEREARLLGRIVHPNVVALHDIGRFGAELCMTLGPVGRDGLDQWLARGQPSHAAVLEVLSDAGRGLAAAHAAGVAHGDLTMRRIRVDERGKVTLVDFDRAVDLTPDPGAWDRDELHMDLHLDPMAPETRASGHRDALSDQFCFCALAWEALAGRRPPLDPSVSSSGVREFRRDPAYRALLRGLSANPTDRWPNMSELVAALAQELGRPQQRWWRGLAGS